MHMYPTYMNRRTFLSLSGAAALTRTSLAAPAPVNKRERMLGWLAGQGAPNYTPAAFFLHFGNDYKAGSAAAKRHLEFFRHTDMDFLKIQFEQTYSRQEFLQKPADWAKLKLARLDFYEPLLADCPGTGEGREEEFAHPDDPVFSIHERRPVRHHARASAAPGGEPGSG